MPWRVVANHPSCPASKPFGVVNKQTGRLERGGCHETRDMANRQLAALYAKEPQMQRSNLLFGAEWKAVGGSDSGELDGYASVFNNADDDGDVVLPGAFKKTLADWSTAKSPLPLIADHQLSTQGVIGSVVSASEDPVGVRVRARFSSTQKAQDIRTNLLEGHINGMSFTYDAVRSRYGVRQGKSVRYLDEVRLYEVTVTPFPMNAESVVLAVKAGSTEMVDGIDWDLFAESMSKALTIPDQPTRKATVDLLVARYHPNDNAADPADEQVTADAAAESGTATGDYAADFLTARFGPRDDAPGDKPPKALVDPLISLKVDRQNADADRLEAEINRAKEANRR